MKPRFLQSVISDVCKRRGITLTVLSDGWVLVLQKGDVISRIHGTNFDLNTQAVAAIAKDKVATSVLLRAAGVGHVEHDLIVSRESGIDEGVLAEILRWPVVLKPLEGSHGSGVMLIESERQLHSALSGAEESWAVCPYVDVRHETRVVILNGTIALAHLKTRPVTTNGLRLFNLHAGAAAEPLDPRNLDPGVAQLALDSMSALGLTVAAVDIVTSRNGASSVLEINAGFSLNRYAASSVLAAEQTRAFYDMVVEAMFEKASDR